VRAQPSNNQDSGLQELLSNLVHHSDSTQGDSTTLVVGFAGPMPRHDATDYGKTTLTLLSKEKKVLFNRVLNNYNCNCLGYNRAHRAYVLDSFGESVIVPAIDAFFYIPEQKPQLLQSKFNSQYVAYTTMPGPDLHFVAFVGKCVSDRADATPHLYVLDTMRDRVVTLGAPPAPPPCGKDEWGWGRGAIGELEPSVCKFTSPNSLRVTYGSDTYRHRAKQRTTRMWNFPSP